MQHDTLHAPIEVENEEQYAAQQTRVLTQAEVEARVRSYFHDIPVMVDIAWCESKYIQHTKDGEVMRGVVQSDMGVMQVNEYYHGETAQKLGLDLTTLEDNMAYARYLYVREGTRPWNSSKHCWAPRIAMR